MSIIANPPIIAGTVPTAATLNAPYNAVAADSVTDPNTKEEWAGRAHLNIATPINKLFTKDYDGTASWAIPATTFTTIANVSATEINPAYTLENNALVRVSATGLVGAITIGETNRDGNGTGGQSLYNTYAFHIKITYNTTSTAIIAAGSYSLSGKARLTFFPTSAVVRKPIAQRSFGLSGCVVLSSGDVINKVELQAAIGSTANAVGILHNHLNLIIAET